MDWLKILGFEKLESYDDYWFKKDESIGDISMRFFDGKWICSIHFGLYDHLEVESDYMEDAFINALNEVKNIYVMKKKPLEDAIDAIDRQLSITPERFKF